MITTRDADFLDQRIFGVLRAMMTTLEHCPDEYNKIYEWSLEVSATMKVKCRSDEVINAHKRHLEWCKRQGVTP